MVEDFLKKYFIYSPDEQYSLVFMSKMQMRGKLVDNPGTVGIDIDRTFISNH